MEITAITTAVSGAVDSAETIVGAIIALYIMYRGARFVLKFFR